MLIFITHSVRADLMCEDATDYFVVYEINTYTCSSGQYLPANTLGCVSCPVGFTCNGGTFDFNPDYFQGIDFDVKNISNTQINNICAINFPTDLFAAHEPNEHTCSAGYYLPANIDFCTICPANNKCIGGTYTFNETTNQGIEPCPSSAPHAPAGSAVCYPHIMHLSNERPNDIIYLKSTATTTPALNIDMNNDGIADVFANMTTTQTHMTSISEHYLKIMVNGVMYFACDDTTCPGNE